MCKSPPTFTWCALSRNRCSSPYPNVTKTTHGISNIGYNREDKIVEEEKQKSQGKEEEC
jgi:hypothetical protein